ncbi:ABC transporter substrate-binding protein [Bdellovibrio sp. KM01]|uniref:substrate-binding periplasmic protein n=1 Tax=Bdellovibrio sp. KM01 TaxID=2748865 RepID=UPI0015EA36E5|nr:transporter substrate-binding domain-containing protein [Bdellovibrio sp. KM01]QLY24909.1 transporter substrate-binding domain-containing protein [Bdellovibrio sp. KM01]
MNLLVALFSLLLMGASANRDDSRLTFVGYNMPPFYMRPDATGISGAVHEIIQELCEREKLSCRFTILPFAEALKNIGDGKMEMGGPVAKTPEREKLYYFSTPIFHSSLAFFGLEKNVKNIKSYKDLMGKKVGVTKNSIPYDSLSEINEGLKKKINILPQKDPLVTAKMAELGTYHLAYLNEDYGKYWIKRYRSKIQEVPELKKQVDYYIIFSRKSMTDAQFATINAQIKKMIEEKVIEKIAQKYGLQSIEWPAIERPD